MKIPHYLTAAALLSLCITAPSHAARSADAEGADGHGRLESIEMADGLMSGRESAANSRIQSMLDRISGGVSEALGSGAAGRVGNKADKESQLASSIRMSTFTRALSPMGGYYTRYGNGEQVVARELSLAAAYVSSQAEAVASGASPASIMPSGVNIAGSEGEGSVSVISVASATPVSLAGTMVPNTTPTPLPAAIYLAGSGFLGIAGFRKKLAGDIR
ncbi:hypothetical protein [Geobacter pickeringii]|uniref:PEP-CTERM protein-sorting domain-containing protein n=1 Tax=Geobacter pickeringii TaxID=345632 RepID=A0A0B5BGQ5_9BACT|nr:hypothetical protein [Geobacter pickeringii]AJE03231.1 hypothetical protein GPICK_07560 [Geobacter pickeringii]